MKITEVISSPELNEASIPGMVWNAGAKILGAGAGSSKEAIAKLGAKWAEEIGTHGKPVTSAADLVGEKFAKDPKILKAAEKEAANIGKGAVTAANKTGVVQTLAKGAAMVNKTADLAATLTKIGISAAAVLQYNRRMDAWQKDLDSGAITPDQFELARRQELSVMIGQIAASFMTFGAAKIITSIVRFIPGLSTGLSTYAMYKLGDYLMTPEGSKLVATAFVNEFYDITPILGGIPAAAIDKIKSVVTGAKPPAAGQAEPGVPAAAPAGTTAEPAPKLGKAQQIPGTGISTRSTGPDSFDIDYSSNLK